MSRVRYTKYIPHPLEEIDLEELVNQLKDFFLESGFYSPFYRGTPFDQTLESLYQALAEILSTDERLPSEWREALDRYVDDFPEGQLPTDVQDLLDRLIQRLVEANYIRASEEGWEEAPREGEGSEADPVKNIRFELTEKSLDFLGYKTLRELMSSLGRSSFGRHETHQLSTGVQSDSPSRPYEFGDTLNLDISATFLNAVKREGLKLPLNLEYQDLMVYQTDYHSSCATVLMLDCSHSMILYGGDRFTPAKK
ncbi:MAG: hypothetical protein IH917_06925, partial [Acidobacteria bacterium]|nr:hypothetical protein [Acidobacteriota bacterium]